MLFLSPLIKRQPSLLLEQFNSAFSIPLSDKVVTDPVSFFAVSNACYKKSEVLLTSINYSEQIIIDAISEISASSAPGGIQASFWKKCAIELAVYTISGVWYYSRMS